MFPSLTFSCLERNSSAHTLSLFDVLLPDTSLWNRCVLIYDIFPAVLSDLEDVTL